MEAFVGRTVCSDAILIRFAKTPNVARTPHWLNSCINHLSRINSDTST
ncbi:hypothetical protein RBSWK_00299 [Rhodopirellula baltica SWK14]|uniref:Uncharacterized protein n=1 Tax=Rhodopirellula baltica SWK14 TaxID=993516 RepID=L7CQG8_RHOBT|nr:hypothetical protein RBSWK_00299 [Rhodopirellula baltica SWK14]